MLISTLVEQAHATAITKGWHEDPVIKNGQHDLNRIAAHLMLIVTEVAEAMECVRDNEFVLMERADSLGKPEGLPSELADIVIRVADLCGALGIDLDDAIEVKMAYNQTRTRRHGRAI